MKGTVAQNESAFIEKVLLKFTIIILSSIIGSIYFIGFLAFNSKSYILPISWIVIDLIFVAILILYCNHKLKLNNKSIFGFGFIMTLLMPVVWMVLPLKVPDYYVGLRETDPDGYVLNDEYCNVECKGVNIGRYVMIKEVNKGQQMRVKCGR